MKTDRDSAGQKNLFPHKDATNSPRIASYTSVTIYSFISISFISINKEVIQIRVKES
jgi:hypothetical protein